MRRTLASAILFGATLAAWAGAPPDSALWNSDSTAAVAASLGPSGTQVTAYLRQQDGSFNEIDLSAVEGGNFGKLGRERTEFERFETKPIAWLPRDDGLFQVAIQTQAWRSGQRYTVSEPVLFRIDGTVMWR